MMGIINNDEYFSTAIYSTRADIHPRDAFCLGCDWGFWWSFPFDKLAWLTPKHTDVRRDGMRPNPVTIGIKWSRHAEKRWRERFPCLIREEVFGQSVAASRKIRTKIRKQCKAHRNTLDDWIISHKGALVNREHSIVFIIGFRAEKKKVVTVFPLN